MTPRFVVLFVLLFAAMVGGEWVEFLRGATFGEWPLSSWLLLVFVLLSEAAAVWIITLTVDRALPAAGNRAPTPDIKQSRRGRQKYSAR